MQNGNSNTSHLTGYKYIKIRTFQHHVNKAIMSLNYLGHVVQADTNTPETLAQ